MQRTPRSLLLTLACVVASTLLPTIATCAPSEAQAQDKAQTLAHYTFEKGKKKAALASQNITASPLHFEERSLAGISPAHEQAYFLLANDGCTLPANAAEAEESPHYLSFVVSPAPKKKTGSTSAPLTLHALTFDLGAASPKVGFDVHAFAVITIGNTVYREEATFSDSAQGLQGLSGAPLLTIAKGGTRGTLPAQARISLAQLPAPLEEAAHIRLYIYADNLTGGPIPAGTNYSIRLDDLALQGAEDR